jgi:hypothetical protein
MTFTVRPRGQLLPAEGGDQVAEPAIEVTAVVWADKAPGSWGGIIEAGAAAQALRERVLAGQNQYRLRLADGREGLVDLALSDFEADGARPLTFSGASVMSHG